MGFLAGLAPLERQCSGAILVDVLQRKKTIGYIYILLMRACVCVCVCVYRERDKFIKELACEIMVAGKSEICSAGQQAGNSSRVFMLQS